MAHEISTNRITGQQEAYFADKAAWHQLGTVVEGARSSEQVLSLAGLDWSVLSQPLTYLHTPAAEETAAIVEGRTAVAVQRQIEGSVANIRSDTGDSLGIVSTGYQVFQNAEAFAFMDSVIQLQDQTGVQVLYESAGALKGGRIVWLLARLPGYDYAVKGDEQRQYMLLANGHDGKFGFVMKHTDVRVVCWNTLSWALNSTFRARHTGKALQDRVVDAQATFEAVAAQARGEAEVLNALADKPLDTPAVQRFLDAITPFPKAPEQDAGKKKIEAYEREAKRIENLRAQTVANLDHETNKTAATRFTGYGMLNAATYWADHQRQSNEQLQLESSWFGDSASFKAKARAAAEETLLAV